MGQRSAEDSHNPSAGRSVAEARCRERLHASWLDGDGRHHAVLHSGTLHSGLPFAVRVPNADTQEALRQADTGDDLVEDDGLDDLKVKFG